MSLATWVLKPALVIALAYAAQWLVRKRGAAARHLVWTTSLLFLAILPLLPSERLSVSALTVAIPVEAGRIAGPLAHHLGTGLVEDAAAPFVVEAAAATEDPGWTFPIHLLSIAGTLAVLAHWGLSFRKAMAVVRAAHPYTRYREVPVLLSESARVPFTVGWRDPVIVLPVAADEHWPEHRREHVLAHEYAHVARYDWLTQSLAHAVCAVYWFHPLVWLAAAVLRRESEIACDDAAILATDGDAAAYAEDLFLLACDEAAAGGVAMWGRSKSQLEVRVMHIVNPYLNRRPLNGIGAAVMVCGALALFLPVIGVRLQAQPSKIHLGGEVRDPSGAAVPGAKIEVRTTAAPEKVAASGLSGPDGSISLEIEPGSHTFTVMHPGFAPVSGGPVPFVNSDAKLHVALRVGQLRENVTVIGVRPAAPPPTTGRPQRIRVGGNIQAASLIHKVDPLYSVDLQSQGVEGYVELDTVISREGNVTDVHSRSLGQNPRLVQAAIDAVRQWRYRPAMLNGETVEVLTTVTVRFLLN